MAAQHWVCRERHRSRLLLDPWDVSNLLRFLSNATMSDMYSHFTLPTPLEGAEWMVLGSLKRPPQGGPSGPGSC